MLALILDGLWDVLEMPPGHLSCGPNATNLAFVKMTRISSEMCVILEHIESILNLSIRFVF